MSTHVFLVSNCLEEASLHSRAVLDAHADRISNNCWCATSDLQESLRARLQETASPLTAVKCYCLVEGGLTRLWVVGTEQAADNNATLPTERSLAKHRPHPAWIRDVILPAQSAGYLHDWGKSGQWFARMLETALIGEPEYDPVRHEWISRTLLLQAFKSGFGHAWSRPLTKRLLSNADALEEGIPSREAALEFLITTHHRLLGPASKQIQVDASGHINKPNFTGSAMPAGTIAPVILTCAKQLLDSLGETAVIQGADYWRPVALLARAALILADHQVSSIDYQGTVKADLVSGDTRLFANTKRDATSGQVRYDQPLDWHLMQVGEQAAAIAHRMGTLQFEALSADTVRQILAPASHPRFAWQDDAVAFLQSIRSKTKAPALIFNMAGTGAGKTRANAKTACALSERPRFCVALNLRSLTLQTGDSLKDDLKLTDQELAVVIGDKVSKQLHEHARDAFNQTDEPDLELLVSTGQTNLPDWLQDIDRQGKASRLLPPPVLVSTIDFIINAGEPGRQGHHALALLRMMDSDLVW